MGFELPNGKTARNIQEQVKFLTEKVKELIARVNELELHIEIVDELPETGSSDVIYFVPVEDPEEGNYYNEYMWIDDAWELIGTTQIDLSGYVDLASAQTITGVKTIADTASANSPKLQFQNEYITLGLWANGYQLKTDGPFNAEGNISTAAKIYISDMALSRSSDFNGLEIENSKNLVLSGVIFPKYNNEGTIGTSSLKWNSLFTTGLTIDGTNGEIKAAYTIQPATGVSVDLGKSNNKWKDLYLSGKASFSSHISLAANSSDGTRLEVSYDNVPYLELRYDSIRPQSYYSPMDLGSSSTKWQNLYLSGNLTDGTNSVSVAQLASGIGGTYRHVIYIEGATADINIAVNLNSATAITTQAALAAINNNVMGGTATLDVQGRYTIVAIDSVGTVGSIVYLDDTGQHTLNIVDIYQDVVNQI